MPPSACAIESVPGRSRMRSLRAVAGDRDVDELRVDLLQLLVAKAVLLGRAGAEVLPEDIGLRDELAAEFRGLRATSDSA